MMKKLKQSIVFGLALLMFSCTDADDYKSYLESGEIRYAAKPEDIKVYSGNERIKLEWRILSDQNIKYAKIYWRNKSDSIEVPITRTSGIDTVSKIINLPEGPYSFQVVHFHEDGVKSLPVSAAGNSYGKSYEATLLNRGVVSHSFTVSNQGISINWGVSDASSLGTKISYTNINNDLRQFIVDPKTNSSSYTRLMNNTRLEYKTMFKPDETCIDTFYTLPNYIPIKY
ncbi:DUF4998 domain-containing protein [Sphingobacterium sp.]|uniref:DUF4998 domain-containing protein n=1 Tax=Sphingobacterium sp. TaxID=341027 RepID=UPI00289B936F|nr:DUF4998 domain-containing protein [Sphingobacterium sp.]